MPIDDQAISKAVIAEGIRRKIRVLERFKELHPDMALVTSAEITTLKELFEELLGHAFTPA